MGQGAFELELKFTGAPIDVAAMPQSRLLQGVATGEGRWAQLRSLYYDTPGGALAKEGVALRLREGSGKRIQTLKRDTAAGAVVREEFEIEINDDAAFPHVTGDADIDALLRANKDALVPTAEIRVDRWRQLARFAGCDFEIAVDLGVARARGADEREVGGETPIAELEIEYKSGEMSGLFAFAHLIADNAPLRLAARSKLGTARAVGAGALFALGKMKKPVIDGDAPAVEALQAMLAAVAVRVINIQGALLDIRAVEGVHQMRVALRRFRSVERTFRRALKTDALYKLTRRARSIAHALGPARDLDVFLGETLPDIFERDYSPPENAAMENLKATALTPASEASSNALRARAEAMRAAAWAKAHSVVADKAFTHFALDLLEAGVLAPWREMATARGEGALHAFAPMALDKALRGAREVEAAMDRRELAARHPLRIALKKLRYSAQMLGPLFPRERRKPYMAALSRLQEALGAVNDAVVAQALAEEIGAGGGAEIMGAAGFIAGFKSAQAHAAAAEIDRAWEIFDKTAPFWLEENARDTDYPLP